MGTWRRRPRRSERHSTAGRTDGTYPAAGITAIKSGTAGTTNCATTNCGTTYFGTQLRGWRCAVHKIPSATRFRVVGGLSTLYGHQSRNGATRAEAIG